MMFPKSQLDLTEQHAAVVQQRFAQYAPGLRQKLARIYGQQVNFDGWMSQLLAQMGELAHQRSPTLAALDAQRVQTPDWFLQQEMVAYCAYVDRFAGNLQGVKKQIPHLTKLGVRYLHLLPFLRARDGENDGGFAVSSFDEIQESLGTIDDLCELTAALREQKISLCADFVLNHVADDHPWAMKAKQGSSHYQAFFHLFADRELPDQFEKTVGQIFPQAAPGNFSFCSELKQWVWTTFYPYQWDLNYRHPEVFAQIALALLRLANLGIEVFRLDSTAFLWKRLGSNCMNQAEVHVLLQALRDIVDMVAPGVLLKAEAIVATADLPAYLGDEAANVKECHIAYHSSLMASSWLALAEQKVDVIEAVIAATPTLPAQASWLNYVRCHDDIGWNVLRPELGILSEDALMADQRLRQVATFFSSETTSYPDGLKFQASDANAVHGTVGMSASLCGIKSQWAEQESAAIDRLMLVYGLSFCFGGMPLIYMGDELGQNNDVAYQDDPAKSRDDRWLQRPYFDQDALMNIEDRALTSSVVFARLCQLLAHRRALSALAAHAPRRLLALGNAQVLCFVRGDVQNSEHVIYMSNFSEAPQVIERELIFLQMRGAGVRSNACDNYVDVLSEELIGPEIHLPAYAQRWLRLLA